MIEADTRQHSTTTPLWPRLPVPPDRHLPESTLTTLRWFIRIRYTISLVLFAILTIAYAIGVMPAPAAAKLAIANALYVGASVFYNSLLNRKPAISPRRLTLVVNLQVPEMLFLCTIALYYSGGALTPLFILYPLVILGSIILTDPQGVYRTGLLAVAFYCSLAVLEAAGAIPQVKGRWGSNWGFQPSLSTNISPDNYITYALYVGIISSVLLLAAYIGNRVALHIRQRNEQIEAQLQDSRALYDIANKLGSMMDEDQMLSYLASTLKSLDDTSMCLVGLLDKDGNLEIKASAGAPPDLHSRLRGLTSSTPGLASLLQRGETVAIDDIQQHPQLRDFALKPGSHSVYIFPIKAESTVMGGISISFDRIKPLSPELTGLMTTITTQAALAIQRAHLISDAHRLANEMSQLYTLGLYTGSTLSKDEVLRRTSDNIESLMNPDAYYIALYNEVNDLLCFEVFVEHGRPIGRMKMPLDSGGVTSRVIQGGHPILVQDWSRNELQITNDELQVTANPKPKAQNPGSDMLSYLGVPMMWEDQVIGVLSVQCEKPMAFDPHDERLLVALAAQTAMALENAKLHQFAQDQAKLDSLTLVYNHGYFVELVRTAVANSDTDDTQVSLIMLDIDHFKQYNDSFGHVAGDNVLRMVAQALKNCVREADAVGRWGGEEFGVLLLGVGTTEAKKIARQIRRAISELSPANGYGQILPNPTISQGISSYPYPSATANDLIEEADSALYHAKKHGRNQLVVYESAGGMKDDTTTTGHLTRSKTSKDLHITSDNIGRSRYAKQLEQELAATTNELGEGTNPNLVHTSSKE